MLPHQAHEPIEAFPSIYPHAERLYLAESICAVVEVKSNLPVQWKDAVEKAKMIQVLNRVPGGKASIGHVPEKIPVFVVGYKGWETPKTLSDNLTACNAQGLVVSGVLQLVLNLGT